MWKLLVEENWDFFKDVMVFIVVEICIFKKILRKDLCIVDNKGDKVNDIYKKVDVKVSLN